MTGKSPREVEQAMGIPIRRLTVGDKLIYVYKDVKVTFSGGKVISVE